MINNHIIGIIIIIVLTANTMLIRNDIKKVTLAINDYTDDTCTDKDVGVLIYDSDHPEDSIHYRRYDLTQFRKNPCLEAMCTELTSSVMLGNPKDLQK